MKLPNKYNWLNNLQLPITIVEGLKLYGTLEAAGTADNPTILKWPKEVGGWEANYYNKDSIPWCGLFVALVCRRAGKEVVNNYLRALSWSSFGMTLKPEQVGLGDVMTFTRKGGGHVGFYIAEDATHYHVLGGNQSDSVNITRIAKNRIYSGNRPRYTIKPLSVRKYWIEASGEVSENEA